MPNGRPAVTDARARASRGQQCKKAVTVAARDPLAERHPTGSTASLTICHSRLILRFANLVRAPVEDGNNEPRAGRLDNHSSDISRHYGSTVRARVPRATLINWCLTAET